MIKRRTRGMTPRQIQQTADLFAAASSPVRLALLLHLEKSEATVGDLAARLKLSHAVASQHLNKLRLMQILTRRKDGREAYYRLTHPEMIALLEWIHSRAFANASFQGGAAI